MRIEQLTCAIGAELLDVNLADAVRDDGLFDEIYAALLQHRVLFIKDQTLDKLSRLDHMAFAQKLGELETHPMVPSHPEAPGLVQIYKNSDSPIDRYENSWHTDGTFREKPALGCVLRCIECPPVGGDTMWANMVLAYEKLPHDVKQAIDGLIANHSFNASFAAAMPIEKRLAMKGQYPIPWFAPTPTPGKRSCSSTPLPPISSITTYLPRCATDRTTTGVAPTCSST
jgi:taurine dioxygenase